MLGMEQYVSSEGRYHGTFDFNCLRPPKKPRNKAIKVGPPNIHTLDYAIKFAEMNAKIARLNNQLEMLLGTEENPGNLVTIIEQALNGIDMWQGDVIINGGSASEVIDNGET